MQLGFVSAILPEYSLDQVLGFAKAEGFGCVEVMCWPAGRAERKYAGTTHVDVTDFTQAKADDVLACCDRHGVRSAASGSIRTRSIPIRPVSEPAIAHLRRIHHRGPPPRARTVNSFVGRDWRKTVDDNWPRFLEVWRPLAGLAEDHGVRIAIENCPMLFTADEWPGGKNLFTTPAIWRRAFADIGSPALGLNYDPSHFVLQGMDPASPLEPFRDRPVAASRMTPGMICRRRLCMTPSLRPPGTQRAAAAA